MKGQIFKGENLNETMKGLVFDTLGYYSHDDVYLIKNTPNTITILNITEELKEYLKKEN